MIAKNLTYAVIGASNNENKFGFKVLKDLSEAGFKVIPINPRSANILGLKTYPDLLNAPEPIDVAVFVVPPAVALAILPDLVEAGIKKAWFQPGAESEAAVRFCQENGIDVVNNACIMVERRK